MPHTHVRRTLTVVATLQEVRILDGVDVIARHPRSFDKAARVENPEHIAALVTHKRHARHLRGQSRLAQAAPNSETLLAETARRGGSMGATVAALLRLLDAYGAAELEAAIDEALERGVPHPNAVRLSLTRRREQHNQPPPIPVDLPGDPRVRSITVRHHDLGGYDRLAIEDLMGLDFLKEAANVVLVGPNGVGKSTIAANIAHRAVLEGHTVRFATAASMLGDLAAIDSDTLLQRKLRFYTRQHLLVIDEVGYLSYSNRHADLLFHIVSSRSQQRPTIITTNRPFSEWGEAFPNAACLVALVDRLVHNAEIIPIDGDSWRRKEAEERQKARSAERRRRRDPKGQRRAGKAAPGCTTPSRGG